MSDTARYADILLPATTQMEHLDLMRAYGHLYLNLCQPAVPPLGEARPNIEVMNALAKAMGYTIPLFYETAEDIIRAALDTDHPAWKASRTSTCWSTDLRNCGNRQSAAGNRGTRLGRRRTINHIPMPLTDCRLPTA